MEIILKKMRVRSFLRGKISFEKVHGNVKAYGFLLKKYKNIEVAKSCKNVQYIFRDLELSENFISFLGPTWVQCHFF